MRHYPRKDTNQDAIADAFRAAGATVLSLAAMGKGCPDLLVGFRGINLLVEVKDGSKPPSKCKLLADQARWHAEWRGQVCVVKSVDDALKLINDRTPALERARKGER